MDYLKRTDYPAPKHETSIAALIALYRSLQGALTAIDGAVEARARTGVGAGGSLAISLMREERRLIEQRRRAVIEEIAHAPVRTRYDAIQRLRFQLMELGDDPEAAEMAVQDFIDNAEPRGGRDAAAIGRRLDSIEQTLSVVALGLGCGAPTAEKADKLQALVDSVLDEIEDMRGGEDEPLALLPSEALPKIALAGAA